MPRVLIVDDAVFMRTALRTMLERNGFEVAGEAANGLEGVKKFLECQPDIVTMDITMPEMSGLEALVEIRKLEPKAKVIMVSAMGQEDIVRKAVLNGAKTFIVKPYKEEHIIQALKKVASI